MTNTDTAERTCEYRVTTSEGNTRYIRLADEERDRLREMGMTVVLVGL
jgi:hypothetical protein